MPRVATADTLDRLQGDQSRPTSLLRRPRRLLGDVMIAFHFACDQNELEMADRLLVMAETVMRRPSPVGHLEHRQDVDTLVAAHERLWDLHHPEPRVQ